LKSGCKTDKNIIEFSDCWNNVIGLALYMKKTIEKFNLPIDIWIYHKKNKFI